VLSRWWRRWRKLRDERILRRRPIPDALWQLTLARYPFLARRGPADRAMLRELATLFLARKEFTGAQGFQLSDEIAVAVAAQACLPVLRLGLDCYDGFVGIVMHRDEVVARREVMDESGVVHHYDETLTGEAMEGGPVMLSWRDVESAGVSAEWGYNVVIHEFAHVLDMRDGLADGMPPLPDRPAREHWMNVIGDEFFAVATEVFFVAPADMAAEHPRLYRLLAGYYLQDPAAETRAP
jgi:hypothetical protein